MKWVKLMRQVNMNSLVDDARETLTIAGLGKRPENNHWNNIHVFALLKLGLSSATVWINI